MDLIKHSYLICVFIDLSKEERRLPSVQFYHSFNAEAKEETYTCHKARLVRPCLGQSLALRVELHLHVTRSECFQNHMLPRLHSLLFLWAF